MLKLYNTFYHQNHTKFLVKADEDCFINLPWLSQILQNEKQTLMNNTNISDYFILGIFQLKIHLNFL